MLTSHASKAMLKILQARLQQSVNCELPDVQAGSRKGRGIRDQISNIHWIIKKAKLLEAKIQRNICFVDYVKAFDCVDHNTLWKILQEMGILDHPTCLLRKLYESQKATTRIGLEQQTGSILEKEYVKAVYFHPTYLTSMQSTSCEMPGWMNHKLESRLESREISITSDMQMTPPLWQKVKKN